MSHHTKFNFRKASLREQRQRVAQFGLATLILASVALPMIRFDSADAATSVLLPNTDVTTDWVQCNAGACGSARYTYIDEDVASPNNADYIGTGGPGVSAATATVEFGMTAASNVLSVSSVQVSILARSHTNANGGTLDSVDINLRIAGGTQTAVTVTPAFSTTNWTQYNATFNGTWTQANLDAAQVLLTRNTLGGGSPTNQQDDVRVSAVSATATYTPTTTFDQSSYRWFEEGESAPLAATNTAATAPDEGTPFRLRMTLHVNIAEAGPGSANFKLQYAQRGTDNVCDTSFTNETYADLSPSSGVIRFYNNPIASDGQGLAANVNDPVHGSDDLVHQTFEESNNFTIANAIPAGDDGLWDFSLVDNNAPPATAYCFRAVDSAGGVLNSYAVVPQITTTTGTLAQTSFRAYENKIPPTGNVKAWGGSGHEYTESVIHTVDGGFVMGGYTATYGNKMFLAKYNSDATLMWSRTVDSVGFLQNFDLIEMPDGSIVVTAIPQSSLYTGPQPLLLIKYNSNGALMWSKTISNGTSVLYPYSVELLNDGGFVVVGSRGVQFEDGSDMFIATFNDDGTNRWFSGWGEPWDVVEETGAETGESVIENPDGSFIVAGYMLHDWSSGPKYFVSKFSSSGVLVWTKAVEGEVDHRIGIESSTDGGFVTVGKDYGIGAGSDDTIVHKFDSSGAIEWARTIGTSGVESANALTRTSDGSYVISSKSSAYNQGLDLLLTKINAAGSHVWSQTWGGASAEEPRDILESADGGLTVVGNTLSNGVGYNNDAFIALFDSNGKIPGCDAPACKSVSPTVSAYTPNASGITPPTFSLSVATNSITLKSNIQNVSDRVMVDNALDNQKTFVVARGSENTESYGHAVVQDSESNYVVVGKTPTNATIDKISPAGIRIFSYEIGGLLGNSEFNSITIAPDGGYVAAGTTKAYGQGIDDVFLVKFDKDGTVIWSTTWGGSIINRGNSVSVTSDGGYVVAGDSSDNSAGGLDAFIAKFNSAGEIQWSRTIGHTGTDRAFSVAQLNDGSYVIGGVTYISGPSSSDILLVRIDPLGGHVGSYAFGGADDDMLKSLVATSDGGFALVADSFSFGSRQILSKFTSSGSHSWTRAIDSLNLRSLTQTSDGGYVVAGTGESGNPVLLRFNDTGSLAWARSVLFQDSIDSVFQTNDGGFVTAGVTQNVSQNYMDYNLIVTKFDEYGVIANCNWLCESPILTAEIAAPSPTINNVTFTFNTTALTTTSPIVDVGEFTDSYTNMISPGVVRNITNGTPLAEQNMRAELLAVDDTFRVRIGLLAGGKPYTSTTNLKLQSGVYTGTCDPSTTSYADVSGATAPLAFFNNSVANTGDQVRPDDTDPTFLSANEVWQTYVESNTFDNAHQMRVGELGLWDFALKADGSKIGRTYCFRIVESGGTLSGGYAQYAEIYIPPTMTNVMRHGTFFNQRSVIQPFSWGRE